MHTEDEAHDSSDSYGNVSFALGFGRKQAGNILPPIMAPILTAKRSALGPTPAARVDEGKDRTLVGNGRAHGAGVLRGNGRHGEEGLLKSLRIRLEKENRKSRATSLLNLESCGLAVIRISYDGGLERWTSSPNLLRLIAYCKCLQPPGAHSSHTSFGRIQSGVRQFFGKSPIVGPGPCW